MTEEQDALETTEAHKRKGKFLKRMANCSKKNTQAAAEKTNRKEREKQALMAQKKRHELIDQNGPKEFYSDEEKQKLMNQGAINPAMLASVLLAKPRRIR